MAGLDAASACRSRIGRIALLILLSAVFLLAAVTLAGEKGPPRYIIFMTADGMGLSNVSVARTYLYGPKGGRLSFETLPHIGYQRTVSRNSFVTDSAAGASAWASGEKFNNGEISCHDENGDGKCDGTRANPETILEMSEKTGLSTGLAVTSDITHATPAAWGSHVHHRKCETEIFRQMLGGGIDVLLGGGIGPNQPPCAFKAPESGVKDLVRQARQSGYVLVSDRPALSAAAGSPKLLGLFKPGGLTPMFQRPAGSLEPTLAQMTGAALETLEKNPRGFFLMVEGSQIDWANHSRNLEYMIHEVIGFHQAVETVRDWMNADPKRSENTLLIVAADHETGGVLIEGPYGSLPGKGHAEEMVVTFKSNTAVPGSDALHTGTDTLVWSNHPACDRALENTDLFQIMSDFLGSKN